MVMIGSHFTGHLASGAPSGLRRNPGSSAAVEAGHFLMHTGIVCTEQLPAVGKVDKASKFRTVSFLCLIRLLYSSGLKTKGLEECFSLHLPLERQVFCFKGELKAGYDGCCRYSICTEKLQKCA